ncbi:aldo/keto reductase [Glaciibacter psychrotolerans]|uniref:D-threo-aldose 1-dehydrogenase n=1 Tax=Glaciibacter psychrotolerans TaxID=670054 RepID=A0A7Z0J7C8_9MICO|nr:aldo/keto reductase [Leifsonia psychrotolerans]NYJ21141.1 D-threo-aldose 1-dehydrogenase [Leifsonia psychrotolerans]
MPDLAFGRIGLGAANVGNLYTAMTDAAAHDLLQAAWDAGVRYFDTAPHYGLGLSERRLGAFLATKPRDEFLVSTKVGRLLRPNPAGVGTLDDENSFVVPADQKRVWDASADGIRASLDESLERLGLDRVDIVFLHDPERYDLAGGLATGLPAMVDLREQGLVSAIGVGSMSTDGLLAAANSGAIDLLMVAGRFTLAEQPALLDVIPACRTNGVGIVNASIFNSGLLATENPGANARYEYGAVPAAVLAKVQAIAAVCREFGVTLPEAALQYTLREDSVSTVIVGANRPAQIEQNVERMATTIPEELWDRLTEKGLIPA